MTNTTVVLLILLSIVHRNAVFRGQIKNVFCMQKQERQKKYKKIQKDKDKKTDQKGQKKNHASM